MASLTVSPASVLTRLGGFALTLTGVGTSWSSGGTTFTVSGVVEAVKLSQHVASATSATVTISTGPYVGTLTVSDGANHGTTTVAGPKRGNGWYMALQWQNEERERRRREREGNR